MSINCLPEYAKDYKYIVYTEVDGEKWFYGAFNNCTQAASIANKIGGYVTEYRAIRYIF